MTFGVIDNLANAAVATAIKVKAEALGFDLCGIAPATRSIRADFVRRWLDDGRAGSMEYLNRRFDERVDPTVYFPGAKSVICVAVNYQRPIETSEDAAAGRIARYALGDDYHEVLKSRLHQLADWIREVAPEAQTRACVDTAPVLERELAARAGIGWIGKHTGLINPRIGSWLLLGEVFTTVDLPIDAPEADHCGTCTRCIDACPTHAIDEPYQLDPRRCISYLTIEHRAEIAEELQPLIGQWLYGCDICQEVCPHNRKAPASGDDAFEPRFPSGSLNVHDVLNWNDEMYRSTLRGSAMKRIKLPMLQRNASIIVKNHAPDLQTRGMESQR